MRWGWMVRGKFAIKRKGSNEVLKGTVQVTPSTGLIEGKDAVRALIRAGKLKTDDDLVLVIRHK